jgi:spore coat polysaccharide biosynthesis protein SpsF
MHRVAIIQARLGSSRLPGKVLKPLAGRPVLEHVVTRVKAASRIDEVVVATSTEPLDDAIEAFCDTRGWTCLRGSERDVLSRYADVTVARGADIVVRATSDCPLFSPLVLDAMLARFDPSRLDYLSTNLPRRTFPVGLDCEVMRADALLKAAGEATDPYDREHVTPYLYRNPALFRVEGWACTPDLHELRVTLDTEEDYQRLTALVAARPELLDPQRNVVTILQEHFAAAPPRNPVS